MTNNDNHGQRERMRTNLQAYTQKVLNTIIPPQLSSK